MRTAVKATLATIAAIAVVTVGYLAFRSAAPQERTVPIPDSALIGFENCLTSKELGAIGDNLRTNGTPIAKHDSAWVYSVNGQFMGIELRRLALGVCDVSGQRDCGWATYVSLGFDTPKDVVRKLLQEKTGIDFTKEQRDNEAEVTMRPVLSAGADPTTSHMFCDSGTL